MAQLPKKVVASKAEQTRQRKRLHDNKKRKAGCHCNRPFLLEFIRINSFLLYNVLLAVLDIDTLTKTLE